VLRSPYNLKAGESFSFYLSDLLSTEHKDWPFYEFENVFADFDNYEKIEEQDKIILFTKHQIHGVTPKHSGHYFYSVDMNYVSISGEVIN